MYMNSIIVKLNFFNKLNFLTCERGITYEELQTLVSEKLQISLQPGDKIEFCNAQGIPFEWETINDILLSTEAITDAFYIQVKFNYDNNANDINGNHDRRFIISRRRHSTSSYLERRKPFSYSKCNNRIGKHFGSPVRRQNCFIGEYPSTMRYLSEQLHQISSVNLRKQSKSIRI